MEPHQHLQSYCYPNKDLQELKTPNSDRAFNNVEYLEINGYGFEDDDNDWCLHTKQANVETTNGNFRLPCGCDILLHYINIQTDKLTSIIIYTRSFSGLRETIYESSEQSNEFKVVFNSLYIKNGYQVCFDYDGIVSFEMEYRWNFTKIDAIVN
jgi:hypothetical protein